MNCLPFTVFTLVLICALFKGTESAERGGTPSIRYTVKYLLDRKATEKHFALSPPWGNWFLNVNLDVPTFVSEQPQTDEEWTPIAQLKVIDDKIHVIMLAGSAPDYKLRYYRLPSNGSGLLLAPKDKLYRIFKWGLFPDIRPDVMESRDIIDLITWDFPKHYTISIQSSTTVPPVYRGKIPVYTTIVHLPSIHPLRRDTVVQMYQAEAESTVNITSLCGLRPNTDLGMSRTGSINVIYPTVSPRFDDSERSELYHNRWIKTWISTTETPHILELAQDDEVVFKDINPLLSNAP